MAGFFDFIKKPTAAGTPQDATNTVPPAPQSVTEQQSVTTQTVVQQEGQTMSSSGGSYNGIGNPPRGQAYNGIGAPPAPQMPTVATTQTSATQSTTQTEQTPNVVPQDAANAVPPANGTTPPVTGEKNNTDEKKELSVAAGPASLQSNLDQKKREELDLMTHLTQRSNRVFLSAQNKAKELQQEMLDSEHLLHGLLSDSEIYKLFNEMKVYPQVVEEELAKIYKKGTTPVKTVQLSPRIKQVLNNSLTIARKLGYEFVSPEHILIALYEEGEGVAAQILTKLGLKKDDLNKKVTGKKEGVLESKDGKVEERGKSMIGQFTIDLTAKALQGLLDPVVERSEAKY